VRVGADATTLPIEVSAKIVDYCTLQLLRNAVSWAHTRRLCRSGRHLTEELTALWERLGVSAQIIVERSLPLFSEASELVVAEVAPSGREHRLIPATADAWRHMQRAAREDAVALHIVSAFRSIARQAELIANKLETGQALSEILAVSAPPGCSEHHTGRAVDVGTEHSVPLQIEFEQTEAFEWLCRNAERFGFALSFPRGNRWGYQYEPWHWCHRG